MTDCWTYAIKKPWKYKKKFFKTTTISITQQNLNRVSCLVSASTKLSTQFFMLSLTEPIAAVTESKKLPLLSTTRPPGEVELAPDKKGTYILEVSASLLFEDPWFPETQTATSQVKLTVLESQQSEHHWLPVYGTLW